MKNVFPKMPETKYGSHEINNLWDNVPINSYLLTHSKWHGQELQADRKAKLTLCCTTGEKGSPTD